MRLKGPSGTVYKFKGDPTQEQIDQIVAYDKTKVKKPEPTVRPKGFIGPIQNEALTPEKVAPNIFGAKPPVQPKPRPQTKEKGVFDDAIRNAVRATEIQRQDEAIRAQKERERKAALYNPNTQGAYTFDRNTGQMTVDPALNATTEANALRKVGEGVDISKGLSIAAKGLGNIVLGAQEAINPGLYQNIDTQQKRELATGVGKGLPIATATVLTGGTTAPELAANLGLGVILGVTEEDPLYNIAGNAVFKLFGKLGSLLKAGNEAAWKEFTTALEAITPDPAQAEAIAQRAKEMVSQTVKQDAERVFSEQGIEGLRAWSKEQGHELVEKTSPAPAGPATATTKKAVETAKAGEKPVIGKPVTEDVTEARPIRTIPTEDVTSKEKINAEEIRKDTGQVREGRKPDEGLQDKGSQDFQRPKEAGAEAGKPKDEVGISHERVQNLRDKGLIPGERPKTVKSDADLITESKKYQGKEGPIAENVLANEKRTLTDPESVALGDRLAQLVKDLDNYAKNGKDDLFDATDAEATRIADALDASGTRQGRAFRARQFLMDGEGSPWIAERRLRKKGVSEDRIKTLVNDLKKAQDDATKLNEKVKEYENLLNEERAKGTTASEYRARGRTRETIRKEREDLFRQFAESRQKMALAGVGSSKKRGAAAKITAEDLKNLGDQAVLIGKIARSYAREGIATLEDVVINVQKAMKDRFDIEVDRQAVIDSMAKSTTRTKSEIQIEYEKLLNQAKKESTEVKANTYAKKKALEDAKKANQAKREAQKRFAEADKRVQDIDAQLEKAKEKGWKSEELQRERRVRNERRAQAKQFADEMNAVAKEKARIAQREFGDQWSYQERVFQYEEKIANLQNELKTGRFKIETKREQQLSKEIETLKKKAQTLVREKQARIQAEQPKTIPGRIQDFSREVALANPEARALDLISNTVKLGSYAIQNPLRSVMSLGLFGKTAGREKFLFTWPKLKATLSGAPSRWKDELGQIVFNRNPESIAKYGNSGIFSRFAGVTDIMFKDFYFRAAADDYAVDLAKKMGGTKTEIAQNRMAIFRQIAEDAKGPLAMDEAESFRAVATEFALRNTFNSENLASKVAEGFKNSPAAYLDKQAGKEAGDTWRAFADLFTRFSKVIGNIALERANYNPFLGIGEAAGRTVYGKFREKSISALEGRRIVDLASKGMTGLAMIAYGKAWIDKNPDNPFLKGEIVTTAGGTKFVKWTLLPGILGGMDADQLGGMLSPFLVGGTQTLIEKSDLTDKQKESLMKKYMIQQTVNQPIVSGPQQLIEAATGDKDAGQLVGSALARGIIPGGVSRFAERQDEMQTGVKLRGPLKSEDENGKKVSTSADRFWSEFIKRIPKTAWNPNLNRQILPANEKEKKSGGLFYPK